MKIKHFSVFGLFGFLSLAAFFFAPHFVPANAVVGQADWFSDVNLRHKNVKAIEYLQTNGIVEGYEDGTFKPESSINRAEFLKIVMGVSDYELGGADCYPDVHDEWFAQYVCAATREGLVEGHSDGYFRPDTNINFAEASKIVANTLKLQQQDEKEGDAWYKKYVVALESQNAIPEDIADFNDEITRGQMAEMIWRIDAERTYKLSKSFNYLLAGKEPPSSLMKFDSCREMHDYLADNSREPYGMYVDTRDLSEMPEGAIPTSAQMAEKGGCFTAQTQILMGDGSHEAIKNIRSGDTILTKKDPNSDELVRAKVNSTVKHYVPGYLVINESLEVTPEHVVFVNGSWDVAGNVEIGDTFLNSDGEEVEVVSIQEVNEPTWVYNFEVEGYRTYFANGLYVHNQKGDAATDMSSTNTQVAGVDEADMVKNDGKYVYFLKGKSVRIVDAFPPESMTELDSVDFSETNFSPKEMYVDGDHLIVVGTEHVGDYYDAFDESLVDPTYYYRGGNAKVFVYDMSDRSNVELIRELAIEGEYDSSRKIGDTVYMVSQQYNYVWPWGVTEDWKEDDLVPLVTDNRQLRALASCEEIYYMPNELNQANFLMVTSISLDPNEAITSEVMVGSGGEIYSSLENMYVAKNKYSWYGEDDEKVQIHKFGLDGNDVAYTGMAEVPGKVLNQFSMDEYEGDFRIVTTLGDVWDDENPALNNLYILGSDLQMKGAVEGLAPGERVYSARFAGDRVYIVTFKKVDPLFTIDASDPTNPTVLGQLKIPGFSNYLHPYDENHIIGFGLDTQEATREEIQERNLDFAWYQGIKMALFDVTDMNNPVELHREIIGDRGTDSPLNYDHKALLYSSSKGQDGGALMAFPIAVAEIPEDVKNDPNTSDSTYGEFVFQGAYVYDVSPENGFVFRGAISHFEEGEELTEMGYHWYGGKAIQRILYMGDYFYTVSQDMLAANGMTGELDEVQQLEFAE